MPESSVPASSVRNARMRCALIAASRPGRRTMAQAISNDHNDRRTVTSQGQWPAWRSVMFVLGASAALWSLILLPAAAL